MRPPHRVLQWQAILLRRLPELYVCLALLLTLFLALLTPPLFVPDESAHALRAMQIEHGGFLAHRSSNGVGGYVDSGFAQVSGASLSILDDTARNGGRPVESAISRDAKLDSVRPLRWTGIDVFMRFPNTAAYPPAFYLPQAVGWALAERVEFTIDQSIILARLFAAWGCVAVGWWALRLCAFNRVQMFVYLLLPGVLSLTASCSQDGLLLTCAALIVAILSRPLAAHRQMGTTELAIAALLIGCCAMARPPYVLFAPLLLLPCFENRPVQRRSFEFATGGMCAAAILLLGWHHAVFPLGTVTAPEANPAQQVTYIRTHLISSASTIAFQAVRSTKDSIGGFFLMETNNVADPFLLKVLSVTGLFGVLLLWQDYSLHFFRSRAVLIVSLASIVAGIVFAEYIIWTVPGARVVEGLQPRYELPLLPFFFCLSAWRSQRFGKTVPPIWPMMFLLLALLPSLATPWVAAHRMHGTGLVQALHHAFLT